jgi:hypothetical protein
MPVTESGHIIFFLVLFLLRESVGDPGQALNDGVRLCRLALRQWLHSFPTFLLSLLTAIESDPASIRAHLDNLAGCRAPSLAIPFVVGLVVVVVACAAASAAASDATAAIARRSARRRTGHHHHHQPHHKGNRQRGRVARPIRVLGPERLGNQRGCRDGRG